MILGLAVIVLLAQKRRSATVRDAVAVDEFKAPIDAEAVPDPVRAIKVRKDNPFVVHVGRTMDKYEFKAANVQVDAAVALSIAAGEIRFAEQQIRADEAMARALSGGGDAEMAMGEIAAERASYA